MDPLSTLNEEEVKRRSPQVNLADPVESSEAPEVVKTEPSIASILAKNQGESAAAAPTPPAAAAPAEPTPPLPPPPVPTTSEVTPPSEVVPPIPPAPVAAPVEPAFRRRRRLLMVLVGLVLLGGLGYGGYRLYQSGSLPFKPPVEEVPQEPAPETPEATSQAVAPTVTAIDGKTVSSGAKVFVTTNRPVLTGKGSPNTSISVVVAPENSSFTTTVDASGSWSLTPNLDIANGDHTVTVSSADSTAEQFSFSLGVNNEPAAAAETPAPAPAPAATPEPTATPAPAAETPAAAPTELAATGERTGLVNLISLFVIGLALMGVIASRRYARR